MTGTRVTITGADPEAVQLSSRTETRLLPFPDGIVRQFVCTLRQWQIFDKWNRVEGQPSPVIGIAYEVAQEVTVELDRPPRSSRPICATPFTTC